MAKNPRTEPYIRTANTLDKIGLSKQADNVESLMRVGMAMDAGKPLFNNVEEHREYLSFLKEAKKLIASENTNERTAGEKSFVLGEINRYIELWSFMLEQDSKIRVAKKSLPFSMRYAAQNGGQLTPEQLSLLDVIKPVFRNLWFNGIREEFGNSDMVFTPRELNTIGASIGKSHEKIALERNDVYMRKFNSDMRKQIARAKKMAELDEQREPSQITQVQAAALDKLQSPEARQVTELLVSKQLEPIMQKTNSPEGKQQIAANASALINWFLETMPNLQSSMNLVEEKAQMIGMPSDATLPADFFEMPAGEPDTDGVRWFDEEEINHLKSRSNPKHAILNMEPTASPVPSDEEKPFGEDAGPSDVKQIADVAQPEDVIQTPVSPKTKRTKTPVVEAPATAPVDAQLPLTEPTEPIVDAIDKDVPAATDAGMQNTDVAAPATTEPEQEIQGDGLPRAEPEAEPEESGVLQFVQDIVSSIKGLKEKEGTPEEVLSRVSELQSDIIMGGARARRAMAIIANLTNNVPILQDEPENDVYEGLLAISDEEIEEICILIGKELGVVPSDGSTESPVEEQEHAPGTESSKPGQYGNSVEDEAPYTYEPEPNDKDDDVNIDDDDVYMQKIRKPSSKRNMSRLVKWLSGMGLGAAAIWGIVSQLAPAGAAKEAINPMQHPQSEYSQPAQQAPERPIYTPSVQQPGSPIQKQPSQQQVIDSHSPKSPTSAYELEGMFDPND